jgi:hypothetical protein
MTPFDATTAGELVRQAREDDERMTPGPWRVSMSGYSVKSHDIDSPIVTVVPTATQARLIDVERWLPNADGIVHMRNNLRAMADQLEAACAEVERLDRECNETARDRDAFGRDLEALREEVEASDQRMAAILDGTFATGDGTAQREIERLRSQLSTALRERDEARGECERMRDVLREARYQLEVAASYRHEPGIAVGLKVHAKACAETLARIDALSTKDTP